MYWGFLWYVLFFSEWKKYFWHWFKMYNSIMRKKFWKEHTLFWIGQQKEKNGKDTFLKGCWDFKQSVCKQKQTDYNDELQGHRKKRLYEKRWEKISKIYSKNTLKSWLHAEDFLYLFSHSFSSKTDLSTPRLFKNKYTKMLKHTHTFPKKGCWILV